MKAAAPLLFLVGIALAPLADGQEPSPAPEPERLFQDELDLQANANFVQGSGARAFGMGGAFLARADDATAASWNPAGLSYLKAPELSVVFQHADFEGLKRYAGNNPVLDESGDFVIGYRPFVQEAGDHSSGGFPDFLAFTWPWNAGETSGAVQISFQRVIPFTSSRTITDTISLTEPVEQRQARRTVETHGGFDVLALGNGMRITRRVRLGFTLNRWFNGYEQTFVKPEPRPIPSTQIADFRLSGWNAHLGVIVSPWDALNVGFVLKSPFTADMTLRRSRQDTFPQAPTPTSNAYASDNLKLVLPRAYGVGASWRLRSNLTLSLDYTRSDWSAGRIRNYFTLQRTPQSDIDNPPVPTEESGDLYSTLPYPTLNDPHQQDTEQLRAGVEYVVIKNRLKWPIRAGFFSDGQFFRALEGDAPRFHGFTLGTGLILKGVLLDVAYVRESGEYTDRSFVLDTEPEPPVILRGPADNHVTSHRLYASLIYRFSRRP